MRRFSTRSEKRNTNDLGNYVSIGRPIGCRKKGAASPVTMWLNSFKVTNIFQAVWLTRNWLASEKNPNGPWQNNLQSLRHWKSNRLFNQLRVIASSTGADRCFKCPYQASVMNVFETTRSAIVNIVEMSHSWFPSIVPDDSESLRSS